LVHTFGAIKKSSGARAGRSHLRFSTQAPPREPAQRHLILVSNTTTTPKEKVSSVYKITAQRPSDLGFGGDDRRLR
jgi:hypothetical protein